MEAQQELEASLFQEIRKEVEGNNLVIIVGDFNYPDINWCDRPYTNPTSENFIDFYEDMFLNQYVKEGTREGNNVHLFFFLNQEKIENLIVGKHF